MRSQEYIKEEFKKNPNKNTTISLNPIRWIYSLELVFIEKFITNTRNHLFHTSCKSSKTDAVRNEMIGNK